MKDKLQLYLSASAFAMTMLDADEQTIDAALVAKAQEDAIDKLDYPEWKQQAQSLIANFKQRRATPTTSEKAMAKAAK